MNAPTAAGYAANEPTHAPPWHGLVVWDVFFNALTTGLFMTAAVGELARPDVFAPVARWAYPLALALLLLDLVFLVLDLGDPLRFHHMLRVVKLSSPMSLGTWCLTLYSLPLTAVVGVDLVALLGLLPDILAMGWVRKGLLIAGLPWAFGSMAYKGVLFSTSSQPGWRDARWLGSYHVASAFALGAVLMLCLSSLGGHDRAAYLLRPAVGVLAIVQLIPLTLLAAELRFTLARWHSRGQLRIAAAVVFGVGVLLPLALLSVTDFGVLGVLVGGWAVRHLVVLLPTRHEHHAG